jgi:hypothetical protein
MPALILPGKIGFRASCCPRVNLPDWEVQGPIKMRIKVTDRFVKLAATGGRKSPIFMDDEVIGFGVQVRETGRKSFMLDYTFEGRRRRFYIGDVPDWSTSAARDRAKRIKREVDQGFDPLAVRDERRSRLNAIVLQLPMCSKRRGAPQLGWQAFIPAARGRRAARSLFQAN